MSTENLSIIIPISKKQIITGMHKSRIFFWMQVYIFKIQIQNKTTCSVCNNLAQVA